MSEWLKEHAWKACVGETLPWVRIPLSPPKNLSPSAVQQALPAFTSKHIASLPQFGAPRSSASAALRRRQHQSAALSATGVGLDMQLLRPYQSTRSPDAAAKPGFRGWRSGGCSSAPLLHVHSLAEGPETGTRTARFEITVALSACRRPGIATSRLLPLPAGQTPSPARESGSCRTQ
jgi:hypothetical protein